MGLYLNAAPMRAAQFNVVKTVVWRNSSFSGKSSCAGAGQQQRGKEIGSDRILMEVPTISARKCHLLLMIVGCLILWEWRFEMRDSQSSVGNSPPTGSDSTLSGIWSQTGHQTDTE